MKTSCIGPAAALPDEMVTEVLLRLPVKSLLRFRAVGRDHLLRRVLRATHGEGRDTQ
jgi:hypothetical protein